jgi:hypothetical protein
MGLEVWRRWETECPKCQTICQYHPVPSEKGSISFGHETRARSSSIGCHQYLLLVYLAVCDMVILLVDDP